MNKSKFSRFAFIHQKVAKIVHCGEPRIASKSEKRATRKRGPTLFMTFPSMNLIEVLQKISNHVMNPTRLSKLSNLASDRKASNSGPTRSHTNQSLRSLYNFSIQLKASSLLSRPM